MRRALPIDGGVFVKTVTDRSYAAWEAAGLAWLAEASAAAGRPGAGTGRPGAGTGRPGAGTGRPGAGVQVVGVREIRDDALVLERLLPRAGGPTPEQAEAFGRALAHTHAAGAPAFGAPPDGWPSGDRPGDACGDRAAPASRDSSLQAAGDGPADTARPPGDRGADGWLGPADEPLPLPCRPTATWGPFFAEQRIVHTLGLGLERGVFTGSRKVFDRVAERVASGEFDGDGDDLSPARLHGDLWSGNVMWTEHGAVLIDPAAHGGHRESDLAMLQLFGAPRLEQVLAGYDEVAPLTDGWRERVALHQLHPVMLHAVLFGGGYEAQAMRIARRFA